MGLLLRCRYISKESCIAKRCCVAGGWRAEEFHGRSHKGLVIPLRASARTALPSPIQEKATLARWPFDYSSEENYQIRTRSSGFT